jgi:hypothetical protein
MHESRRRHRRRDYANEISIAADIDQADAEASIGVNIAGELLLPFNSEKWHIRAPPQRQTY